MTILRETPLGFWTLSEQFCIAAERLEKSCKRLGTIVLRGPVTIPILYLFGHSIELSLKAYLLTKGLSVANVKALGHDLDTLLAEACHHGLDDVAPLTAKDKGRIAFVNEWYVIKRLEYPRSGWLPIVEAGDVARRLLTGLKGPCTARSGDFRPHRQSPETGAS